MITTSTFLGCAQPKLEKDPLDLENLSLGFKVDAFYADEIKKADHYHEKVNQLREKIRTGVYKAEEETLDDEKELDLLNDFKLIDVDTIYTKPYGYSETTEPPVDVQYNMRSHNPEDRLAYYDKKRFEKINMMQSLDGDFMALVALNESESEDDFKQLLAHIEQKHGKAKVKKDDFFGSYIVYSWELEDRLLVVSSKYDNKENTLKLEIGMTENVVKIDTTKHPTSNTRLFILNNAYKQDSVVKRLTSGDWLYFKGVLDED